MQHVHTSKGRTIELATRSPEPDRNLVRVPTIADIVPLTEIMARDLTCARGDFDAEQVADLMLRTHIGCVPVVDADGRPLGMITKYDLIERHGSSRPALTAAQLMMPLTIAVSERATIAHAATLMAAEDIHHLLVVDDAGQLIGIVSTMDIVRWLARNDGFTP